jgi:hypothetical protein
MMPDAKIQITELEVLLREHSHKMRIVSNPAKLSGAHMVFEKGIALRIYYHHDIAIIDDEKCDKGTDGIYDFCMSFQWPVVFFVVPNEIAADVYHEGSFIDRVMTMGFMENVADDKSPPRLMIAANTAQVLAAFFAFADDVSSTERREKRSQIVQSMQSSVNDQACVAASIRHLLAPPRCPDGEADIVMRELGTLPDIVQSCSILSGGDSEFDQLPIDRRTKDISKAFFTECLANRDWLPSGGGAAAAMTPPTFNGAPFQYQEHGLLSDKEPENSHPLGSGAKAPPQPHPSFQYPPLQSHPLNYMSLGMRMQLPATMPDTFRAPPPPHEHAYPPPIPLPQAYYYSQHQQHQPRPHTDTSFDPRIQSSRNRQLPNRPEVGRPTYHP